LNDHHNFVGGLARHSLEVATMVASSSLLSKDDRDLGISMALLHDYGKIWCYRDGKYTADHKRGHEVVGLEKLAPHLDILRRESPRSAHQDERVAQRLVPAQGQALPVGDRPRCSRFRSDEL
jgi:hypothetical protein